MPCGRMVWRVYFRGGRYPASWDGFRSYGPLDSARFDHHAPPPREQERGVLYGATGHDAIATCVAEVFQESRVVDRFLREPWLARFSLEEDVPLLSLRGKWPTRAGASMNINSTEDRRVTRGWSRSIYEGYPDLSGILYASSMNQNAEAVVFYERAAATLPTRPDYNRPLSDPSLEDVFKRICRGLGYDCP